MILVSQWLSEKEGLPIWDNNKNKSVIRLQDSSQFARKGLTCESQSNIGIILMMVCLSIIAAKVK